MPFKLRTRKGRYDLSGDLYVIAVQLLDGHFLQCTLSTDSTGKDCMDYICQRLELQQNIFFGLRYKCARNVCRWVELDKPLKKQMEKTAQEIKLFFGVMFHTSNANTLTDAVARWNYFLQMRADVLDERLFVSPEKAIALASYSLQIDFGDHEESKPTVATLRGTLLLPKYMTQSSQVMDDLIKQVLVGYKALRGMTRTQAEILYITEAQQCDGYGEEYFLGRDEDGSDIFVGYCMEGIIVKRLQGPPVKYKWEEIVSIMASRRNFIVNCAELAHAHFQMEDPETAKYAAYVCGLHLQFFRNFCKQEDGSVSTSRSTSAATASAGPSLSSFPSQSDQSTSGQFSTPTTVTPMASVMDLKQQQQLMGGVRTSQYMNGFIDSSVASSQSYLGSAPSVQQPLVALQSPFSYSTTSVDRLPADIFRFEHHQHIETLPSTTEIGPEFVLSGGNIGAPPIASINSPLNPSVSSLGSGVGGGIQHQQQQQQPQQHHPLQPLPQQHRFLANRLPARHHDGLQSWMSQQILAASASNLSLNRSPMSAFNGSVPHIHAIGGGPYQHPHHHHHQHHHHYHHQQPPLINPNGPLPPNPAHVRLFNGPGRPLSLDEFNLSEMLRTAYEFQQIRRQQPMAPFLQQQQQIPRQAFMQSEQSIETLPAPPPLRPPMNGNATAPPPPPVFHAPPPPPAAPIMASPTTQSSSTTSAAAHPGMQYLASLGAFLSANGGVASQISHVPMSPPVVDARAIRANGMLMGGCKPNGVVDHAAMVQDAPPTRPNSAALSLNHGMMGGSDRHFVSTPDLSSINLAKSRSSPDLVTKQEHMRQRQQHQHQQKTSIDARTFENLSIENLDSPAYAFDSVARQAKQTRMILRRDSSYRSGDEDENQPKSKAFASDRNGDGSRAGGAPQRIIVGAAASSSGESDENLDDMRKMTANRHHHDDLHHQQYRSSGDGGPYDVSRDTSRSTIATSSTSTLPDDSISGQQAFQRFNPKIYEQQLIMMQQQQQIQYRQQVRSEQQVHGVADGRNGGGGGEDGSKIATGNNEHHRSVAVLNLKGAETSDDAKERRKSMGEFVEDEKCATGTAHRHRLLVNDHGGSSSEEALRSPDSGDVDEARDSTAIATTAPPLPPNQRNGKYTDSGFAPSSTPLKLTNGNIVAGYQPVNNTTTTTAMDSTTEVAKLRRRFDHNRENHHDESMAPTPMAAVGGGGGNRTMFARDEALKREFENIPKKRVSAGLSTAQRRENLHLNRDPTILPYEDTRVMLRPNKHNPHGYINASHVQVQVGTSMLKYIATQGPLRETVVDFWQMVWESGSRIIIMLTKCMEHGKEQSFPYWPCPTASSEHQKLKFGEYQLTLHNCTESKTHVTSTFVLKNIVSGQKRLLYHLQYLDWPEGGVPGSVDSFMSFVDEVNSVKVHVANEIAKTANAGQFATSSRAASRTNLFDNSNGSGNSSTLQSGGVGAGNGSNFGTSNRKRSTSSLVLSKAPTLEVFGNGNGQSTIQFGTLPHHQHTPSSSSSSANNASFSESSNPASTVPPTVDSQLPPVVVHCSSGAGRTGVYLLTEVMIHALQHNQDLDMSKALSLLRQKRMHLVQTFPQYRFVFTCTTQFMRKSRLI